MGAETGVWLSSLGVEEAEKIMIATPKAVHNAATRTIAVAKNRRNEQMANIEVKPTLRQEALCQFCEARC